MGIGDKDLELLIKQRQLGLLRYQSSVIEAGAQQLATNFLSATERLAQFGQLLGIDQPSSLPKPKPSHIAHGDLEHLDEAAPAAQAFWRCLGFEYAAIDIDGSRRAPFTDER